MPTSQEPLVGTIEIRPVVRVALGYELIEVSQVVATVDWLCRVAYGVNKQQVLVRLP